MSHISKVKVLVFDISALRAAAQKMGFQLLENASPRAYSPQPTANYVVRLPGRYDVGVRKAKVGYTLEADYYTGDVERHVGKGCGLLLQCYSAEVLRKQAASKSMRYSESQLPDGSLQCILQEL